MKHIALVLSIMLIGATAASAQSIEIRPGRSDGPSIGIGSDRHRDGGRSMRGSDDENRGMRRGQREDRVIVGAGIGKSARRATSAAAPRS